MLISVVLFELFANGKEINNRKFRIPLSTVTHLGVVGMGVVTYVSLGEKYNVRRHEHILISKMQF